jgi:hypothetical protein
MTLLHFWVTQPPSPQLCPIWTFKGSNWGFSGAPDPTALCKELSGVTQPIPPLLCPIWTFQGSNWGFLGAPDPTVLCKQLSGVTQPILPQLWPIWMFQGSNWGFLGVPNPTALCKQLSGVMQPILPKLWLIYTFQGSNGGSRGRPIQPCYAHNCPGSCNLSCLNFGQFTHFRGLTGGGGGGDSNSRGPRSKNTQGCKSQVKKLLIALFCPATRAPPASGGGRRPARAVANGPTQPATPA